MIRTGNAVVSKVTVAQGVSGNRVGRQALVPIAAAVANVGSRDGKSVGNRHHVSVNSDNHDHNHIQEVILRNNHNRELPAITHRLEQPVNRRQQPEARRQ